MREARLWVRILSALIVLATSWPVAGQSLFGTGTGNDFLPVEEAFQYSLTQNPDNTVTLYWDIAQDYYLYRKRLTIEGVDGELGGIAFPAGVMINDEFFGESEVYYTQAEIQIEPGEASALSLSWQGCADAGLCYPPQSAEISFSGEPWAGGPEEAQASRTPTGDVASPGSAASSVSSQAEDQSLTSQLAAGGIAWNMLVFFGLGLLLVFTPCVLPMIPILSTVIIGNGAGRSRSFVLSTVYVMTMATTYALMGVLAAMAGANLQAVLQAPVFIILIAIIFVLLALSMFGLYELQLPSFIRNRLGQLSSQQKGGSLLSAGIMGVIAALLASPCMTAPLAGALIYIADTGDTVLGGLALLALGLGMGAPLIALATVGAGLLPRPGGWMNAVKALFGFVLLGTTVYFLERIIDDSVTLALWGALTLALGIVLRSAASSAEKSRSLNLISLSLGTILALWGGVMMVGAAAGGDKLTQPLNGLALGGGGGPIEQTHARFEDFKSVEDLNRAVAEAGGEGQWTLVDFYADWCVSCKVIEEEVFGDASVVAALSDMQLLRADVTDNDALDQALMRHLEVIGPPTILILGPDGQEYRAQRTTGEVSAEVFLERLGVARQS
ncbi:protein-disulfide reductase DsbD [Marinobacter daepoensis]|uniref:protein-disulfide reductase DsbD n=1 Tax=Marinobacter daepoensis TaxID=262077 RepID=UPI00042586D0|nr:protein-disulfide reductase DsbD [Marinobacter daepoensis]